MTKNTSEFIRRSRAKFGNKFDYKPTKYTTYIDELQIICPKHGSISVSPRNHLRSKFGCPHCKHDAQKKFEVPHVNIDLRASHWLQKAKAKFPGFDFSNTQYVSARDAVNVVCPKHGRFTIEARVLTSKITKYACPGCLRASRKPKPYCDRLDMKAIRAKMKAFKAKQATRKK